MQTEILGVHGASLNDDVLLLVVCTSFRFLLQIHLTLSDMTQAGKCSQDAHRRLGYIS